MITLSNKQRRENEQKTGLVAGIEKFRHYAEPRGIYMKETTYALHKIIHKGKTSRREAVEAVMTIDGKPVSGWIINLAGRQRKFVTEADGYKVI